MAKKRKVKKVRRTVKPVKRKSKIIDAEARSKLLHPSAPKTFVLAHPDLYLSNRQAPEPTPTPQKEKGLLELFLSLFKKK